MGVLAALGRGEVAPGLYRLLYFAPAPRLLAEARAWGWQTGYVDGRTVMTKRAFIEAVGRAFCFPDDAAGQGFGRNWDAFDEMMRDLSWVRAPGYLLLYDCVGRFAAAQPGEWQTARAILHDAVAAWQAEGVPFFVLLRYATAWNRELPILAVTRREEETP